MTPPSITQRCDNTSGKAPQCKQPPSKIIGSAARLALRLLIRFTSPSLYINLYICNIRLVFLSVNVLHDNRSCMKTIITRSNISTTTQQLSWKQSSPQDCKLNRVFFCVFLLFVSWGVFFYTCSLVGNFPFDFAVTLYKV